jgi:hypothetical protein
MRRAPLLFLLAMSCTKPPPPVPVEAPPPPKRPPVHVRLGEGIVGGLQLCAPVSTVLAELGRPDEVSEVRSIIYGPTDWYEYEKRGLRVIVSRESQRVTTIAVLRNWYTDEGVSSRDTLLDARAVYKCREMGPDDWFCELGKNNIEFATGDWVTVEDSTGLPRKTQRLAAVIISPVHSPANWPRCP